MDRSDTGIGENKIISRKKERNSLRRSKYLYTFARRKTSVEVL